MNPEEVERVVGGITEKDVMDFARRKLWDQDVAVSAVGSVEGLLDYNRYVTDYFPRHNLKADMCSIIQNQERYVEECIREGEEF